MKPIGKTHPSLKFDEVNVSFDIESFDKGWRTEEHIHKSLIRTVDVQEKTIDKKVLRETIEKLSWCEKTKSYHSIDINDLIKELGLEESKWKLRLEKRY